MSVATLIEHARHASSSSSSPLRWPEGFGSVVDALALLHGLTSSATASSLASSPALIPLAGTIVRAGRRLETLLDGERPRAVRDIVTRAIEPDVVPVADAVALALAPLVSPSARDADGVDAADLAEALALVVETVLGPALATSSALPQLSIPRPYRDAFDAHRHRLLERASGPRDVVVAVERCARLGPGGRLLEPALVIVGGA